MTKKKTVQTYEALVACSNNKTGKDFDIGDTVNDGDFTTSVIKNWIQIGVLKPKGGK